MRLGGFVIHGNSVRTLGECLDGLQQVCDEVVAIDSCSTDGSFEMVTSRGVRSIRLTWQGYGAARAAAAKALQGCDYLFFLDSDEYLLPAAVQHLRDWRNSNPTAAAYRLQRRDWAELSGGRRFLYRIDKRARLVRLDFARWAPEMIVHEALPHGRYPLTEAVIEHRFASGFKGRTAKDQAYALLWAIHAFHEHRRPKPAWLPRAASVVRDLIFRGALFRGGLDAVRLSWAVSRYHAQKQLFLRRVRSGQYAGLVAEFQAGEFVKLFQDLPANFK